jgi:hypothetical protein
VIANSGVQPSRKKPAYREPRHHASRLAARISGPPKISNGLMSSDETMINACTGRLPSDINTAVV